MVIMSNVLLGSMISSIVIMIYSTVHNETHVGYMFRMRNSFFIFISVWILGICTVLYEYIMRENIWVICLTIGSILCCIGKSFFDIESEYANNLLYKITEELMFFNLIGFSLMHAFYKKKGELDSLILKLLCSAQIIFYGKSLENSELYSSCRPLSLIFFVIIYFYIHVRDIVIPYSLEEDDDDSVENRLKMRIAEIINAE